MIEALLRRRADGAVEICAPGPGVVRQMAPRGHRVVPGEGFAVLEVLGRRQVLIAPAGADGLIAERAVAPSDPVGHGDLLVVLGHIELDAGAATGDAAPTGGLVLRAGSSGRFYRRTGPDRPPLVADGAVIEHGAAIGLLEVMKTFTRVTYGGAGLPARARVVRVVPADGADVNAGDVLLELAPAPA